MSYIAYALTPGEKLLHLGRFHWLYIASAVFWLVIGLGGCMLVLGGGIAMKVQAAASVMYPDLPAYLFWRAWGPAIDQMGGYIAVIRDVHILVRVGAFITLLIGIGLFAHMMIIRATTEIGITDERMILKEGIISRHIDEMNIDRIESVHVTQGILGRLLGYGTVMVRGMGVGEIILPPIANPIRLRNAIDHARGMAAKGGRH